jgi:molybdopterin-guanine dinucleotide biosynthesis protein A
MISALIVSGGKSTRMGRDKKFLEMGGRTFIEIAVDVARGIADEIIVVVGSKEQMEDTKALGIKDAGVVVDVKEGLGPVMGVLTGLHAAKGEWAVVMPADAPMMKAEVFRHMLDKKEGYDAVVPTSGEHLEPMYAVYKRDVMIEACTSALEVEGERASLHNVVHGLSKVNYIPVDDFRKYDSELLTFYNVNTESDLEEVLKRVKNRPKV